MNTYYELINFLYNKLKVSEIDDNLLKDFAYFNVYLEDERYQRFINNLTNVLSYRIQNALSKIDNCLEDISLFTNSIDEFINESNNQIKLVNQSTLIYEEDKEKIINFIKANHKDIIDSLIIKFNKYTKIKEYLNSCYLK